MNDLSLILKASQLWFKKIQTKEKKNTKNLKINKLKKLLFFLLFIHLFVKVQNLITKNFNFFHLIIF